MKWNLRIHLSGIRSGMCSPHDVESLNGIYIATVAWLKARVGPQG